MKIDKTELLIEIWRSKLSWTDLSRKDRLALPLPDLYVDRIEDIPADHDGLAQVAIDHQGVHQPPFPPFQLVQRHQVIATTGARLGRVTDRLGVLLLELVTRYGLQAKWRRHPEREEMELFALQEALGAVWRFDLSKWNNAFSFLTTNTFYSFVKVAKKHAARMQQRHELTQQALEVDAYTEWQNEQNDELDDAYAVLCVEMDRLLVTEQARRPSSPPRRLRYKLSNKGDPIAPSLRLAIHYGLSIGLSSAAISQTFGIDPAIMSKMKNGQR